MAARKKILSSEEQLAAALVPESEQPYEVPNNWSWIKAGALIRLLRGVSYKKTDAHANKKSNDCLIMRGGNVGEGCLNLSGENVYVDRKLVASDQLIRRNDVIIVSSTGSQKVIGRAGISSEDYTDVAFGAFLMVARPLLKECAEYIDYFFQGSLYRNKIRTLASGVNINNIRADYIANMPLPLPPLPEQRRIVDRIESLFSTLDEAEERLRSTIEESERRQASILRAAFNGDLTDEWRKARGISSDSWTNTTIGQCCRVGSGGTPSRKNPSYYEGEIPWVKTGEILWNHVTETEEHITQEAIDNSSAKLYQPGAVLVAMYGMGQTRGKAALLDVAATTNQAVCVLEPDESIDRDFLFYFFKRNYWDIREQSIGGNQLNLSATIIKRFEIAIPSMEEQKAIASLLDIMLENEWAATKAAEDVLLTINSMRQTILAKAMRGELGTNDPSESNPMGLLEKVFNIG